MTIIKQQDQSDNQLATLAANGDQHAFEEIYRRHRTRVYSIAYRMTRSRPDAEDLSQECFVTLLRKIGTFRGESSFVTWLCRLTTNHVLMHFRKHSRKLETTTSDGELPEFKRDFSAFRKSTPIFDRIDLESAVNALPSGYRQTLVLHDVKGYEHQEIARMTGRATGTSKSQLNRARAKVRELLAPRPYLLAT